MLSSNFQYEEEKQQKESEQKQSVGHLRKKRSWVWKHFSKQTNIETGKSMVQCSICKVNLSHVGGSTTNLASHLKTKHSMKPVPVPVDLYSKSEQDEITEALVNFILKDLCSIAMVEGEGFREYCRTLNPNYVVPCTETIVSIITQKMVQVQERVKIALNEAAHIAITTDIWISESKESYLDVTFHWIDQNFTLKQAADISLLQDPQNPDNISNTLKRIYEYYNISPLATVTDNGIYMVAAVQKTNTPGVKCAAHTLQLSVNYTLEKEYIQPLIKSCRKIVGYFKNSVQLTEQLRGTDARLRGKKGRTVKLDVPAQWNLTYIMANRLVQLQVPVTLILHQNGLDNLTEYEWSSLEELVKLLQPFYEATSCLSGSLYPTISLSHTLLNALLQYLSNFQTSNEILKKLAVDIRDDMATCWESVNQLELVSTLLDPRFKSLKCFNQQLRDSAWDLLKQEYNHVKEITEQQQQLPPQNTINPNNKNDIDNKEQPRKKQKKDNILMQWIRKDCEPNEISLYYSLPELAIKEDILQWWSSQTQQLPILSQLARKFLCIPATSVPAEFMFSKAGEIARGKLAALSPKKFREIVFLNRNQSYLQ